MFSKEGFHDLLAAVTHEFEAFRVDRGGCDRSQVSSYGPDTLRASDVAYAADV